MTFVRAFPFTKLQVSAVTVRCLLQSTVSQCCLVQQEFPIQRRWLKINENISQQTDVNGVYNTEYHQIAASLLS